MAKQDYTDELIEAVKNLMEWQVKNVDAFDNWAYNDAHRLLAKIAKVEAGKPSNCRNALRDSGKPYPRSGCAVCKNGGLMGCPYEKENVIANKELNGFSTYPVFKDGGTWGFYDEAGIVGGEGFATEIEAAYKLGRYCYELDHGPKQEPYAYIDDKNRLVKISGHVYFDGGFVDANSEIPDSWKTLVLVEKVGA
jgi:hypothetical protein